MNNGGVGGVGGVVGGKAVFVPDSGPLRTVAQAATELNVAKSTIRAWIAQRRVGHVRLGRAIRVPVSEILRVMEEGFTPARK